MSRLLFLPKFAPKPENMDIIDKITTMIEPSLNELGYTIVLLKLSDAARRKTLTLMAERRDGTLMGFDDCTEISRTVSALMDVEDPITTAYNLEVCSPGVDRPLVKFEDYVRYVEYEIKLETLIPITGRKRFRGVITKAANNTVSLRTEEGIDTDIAFTNIRHGRLVMTDGLMKAFLKQQDKQATQA